MSSYGVVFEDWNLTAVGDVTPEVRLDGPGGVLNPNGQSVTFHIGNMGFIGTVVIERSRTRLSWEPIAVVVEDQVDVTIFNPTRHTQFVRCRLHELPGNYPAVTATAGDDIQREEFLPDGNVYLTLKDSGVWYEFMNVVRDFFVGGNVRVEGNYSGGGSVSASGALNIDGLASFSGNVNVQGTTTTDTLTVQNGATISGDSSVFNLTVTGDEMVNGWLGVKGELRLGVNGDDSGTAGQIPISGGAGQPVTWGDAPAGGGGASDMVYTTSQQSADPTLLVVIAEDGVIDLVTFTLSGSALGPSVPNDTDSGTIYMAQNFGGFSQVGHADFNYADYATGAGPHPTVNLTLTPDVAIPVSAGDSFIFSYSNFSGEPLSAGANTAITVRVAPSDPPSASSAVFSAGTATAATTASLVEAELYSVEVPALPAGGVIEVYVGAQPYNVDGGSALVYLGGTLLGSLDLGPASGYKHLKVTVVQSANPGVDPATVWGYTLDSGAGALVPIQGDITFDTTGPWEFAVNGLADPADNGSEVKMNFASIQQFQPS